MWKTILLTTFIAGGLDISAASVSAYLKSGATPDRALRFVASGFFGHRAFTGNRLMLIWGVIFHFIIAFACTACFFLAYPKWKLLVSNPWANSIIVGVTAWVVTELVIIPASNAPRTPFTLSHVAVNINILIFCIGLPIAWQADQYFK